MKAIGTLKFLVVDDMLAMRKTVARQLKELGVTQITEAADGGLGKEQLTQAIKLSQPFNFVVCDWNMPNMTGLELLRYCRGEKTLAHLAFLMVTAESEMSQIADAVASGVDNYLIKPFTPATFKEKISAVYSKRFPNL